jgi:hypothetical protein
MPVLMATAGTAIQKSLSTLDFGVSNLVVNVAEIRQVDMYP